MSGHCDCDYHAGGRGQAAVDLLDELRRENGPMRILVRYNKALADIVKRLGNTNRELSTRSEEAMHIACRALGQVPLAYEGDEHGADVQGKGTKGP